MNKIGQLFSSLDIEKNDVTFIHRGRNKYLSGYFLKICGNDYNYDFRHNPKHKTLNLIFNFIKSVLFLYELRKSKLYIVEGGLFVFISLFIIFFFRNSKLAFNIADPFLFKSNNKIYSKIKYRIKIWFLNRCDYVFTNSPMVYRDLENEKLCSSLYHYRLDIAQDLMRENHLPHNASTKILYCVTRPKETGYIKGLDQAIDIVKSSDRKNDFIFAGSDDFSFTSDNLTKKGFVNDLSELFKISKVLLCPSAYDSYPGVTIECIKYGVIPIVSDQCGSSHDLIKIDTNLVAKYSHTDEWVNKINIVLNYSDDDYRKLVFNLSKLYNKFYKHE